MRGKRQFSTNTEKIEKDTVKRLINIIVKEYKGLWILSLVCILISTAITVAGAFFIEILIDKYIAYPIEYHLFFLSMGKTNF